MSDESALLAAIVAEPDEDTPRLAYADWLDEHATTAAGRARAEFIRVQIELTRLPDWGDDAEEDRRAELTDREKALLAEYRAAWVRPPGPAKSGFSADGIRFRRGFPEEDFFRTYELRDYAHDIRAYPLLRHLSVSALDVFTLEYLLELPWLEEVRGLELIAHRDDRFGPTGRSALAECQRFDGLRSAEFGYAMPLSPATAGRFADNRSLAGVRELKFWEEPGTDALGPLLRGPAFERLRLLEVYNYADAGVRRPLPLIGTNPRCAALERLRLNGYAVAAPELAGLVAGACWPNLREFQMRGGAIAPDALPVPGLASAGRLETLSLIENGLTSLRGLSGPGLNSLRALDLSGNRNLPPAALAELAGRATGLRRLDLSDCYLMDDTAAEFIARSPAFADLHQLVLIDCAVGPAGAVALAESPHLSDRLTLYMHECPLGDDGKAALRDRFGDRACW